MTPTFYKYRFSTVKQNNSAHTNMVSVLSHRIKRAHNISMVSALLYRTTTANIISMWFQHCHTHKTTHYINVVSALPHTTTTHYINVVSALPHTTTAHII